MSGQLVTLDTQERLLTFEVGGSIYALPIACVLEVAEVATMACIPMFPPTTAGAINHHGDALPVMRRGALLDVREAELPEPAHILVITAGPTDGARLGMPVDRIVGLVDGPGAVAHGSDAVAERRQIDDRVVSILDPERLMARAREEIERSLARAD